MWGGDSIAGLPLSSNYIPFVDELKKSHDSQHYTYAQESDPGSYIQLHIHTEVLNRIANSPCPDLVPASLPRPAWPAGFPVSLGDSNSLAEQTKYLGDIFLLQFFSLVLHIQSCCFCLQNISIASGQKVISKYYY